MREDEIFVSEYQQAERVQRFVSDHAAQKSGAAPQCGAQLRQPGRPGEFNRPEGMCVDARTGSTWRIPATTASRSFQATGNCFEPTANRGAARES